MVYKEIEIDSTWQQPLGEIRVIQEEADGRKLIIHLYYNGTPLDLTGKTVSIYIQKPDDTIIYHSCEASGNQVTVILTLQMMAAFGITKLCELQIIDAEKHVLKVTLPPLRIVMSSYDDAIESTDEFSRLTEALAAASSAPAVIEEAKEAARGALAVKNDLIEKRDSGFFNGAPGPRGAQGIQGPKGDKGDKGDRGDSGIQASTDGMYTLYVNEEGHLIAQYTDAGSPPPLSIIDGHLIYHTGE